MRQLTPEGQRLVEDLSSRYGFGSDAVTAMLRSVARGGGGMAQFDHPEFGGMGQWSRGGMTMIGAMFDNALKARVDGLCTDLAAALDRELLAPAQGPGGSQTQHQSQGPGQSQSQGQGYGKGPGQGWGESQRGGGGGGGFGGGASLFVPQPGGGSDGWPAELGHASSTGSQNHIRYAVFPGTRRLAVDIGGKLTVYDTLDHHIAGVSQQQSGDASLTFGSQHGPVRLADLPVVSGAGGPAGREAGTGEMRAEPASPAPEPEDRTASAPASPAPGSAAPGSAAPGSAAPGSADDILGKIERLAALRDRGILAEDEFATKKAELLARL